MDKKILKICYVTNYLPNYHSHAGGAEQAISAAANLMREKGISAAFLTLPIDRKFHGSFDVKSISATETFLGGMRKYIEILKWYIFQSDPVCYLSSKKYFTQTKPDIIHFGNFQFLTFGILSAAKRLNIPSVISIYDYWYFCPLTTLVDYNGKICRRFHGKWCIHCLPYEFYIIQVFFLMFRKKIFDFFLKKVDRFIVLSQSSKQILIDYGIEEDRISIIRLPFSDDFARIDSEVKEKIGSILFAGWMQKRKGLHILLDAMPIVWEKIPEAKLCIVTQKVKWEPIYEDFINSKLKKIPHGRFEFLLGQRKRQEIRNLIKSASIVVVPEQWENMSPLIVIESMLMSKPVIGSDIGGIPEFIQDGKEGFLAKHLDPADFAAKIITLLNNKDMRETLGSNAHKKIAEMLSREAIASQYIRAYEESRVS
jgi:glycosyltransferase involved in cell wall biosynthesis